MKTDFEDKTKNNLVKRKNKTLRLSNNILKNFKNSYDEIT